MSLFFIYLINACLLPISAIHSFTLNQVPYVIPFPNVLYSCNFVYSCHFCLLGCVSFQLLDMGPFCRCGYIVVLFIVLNANVSFPGFSKFEICDE